MDSPLNLAHQQGRKADSMLKGGKFDEAITCHNRAAEYLLEAMQMTQYKTALESLRLQHAHHLKKTDQIYDRQRRAQILQIKQSKLQLSSQATQTNLQYKTALESLRLQHAHHLKKTDQIYDRQRRSQILQIKQSKLQLSSQATQTTLQGPMIPAHVDGSGLTARQDNVRSSSETSLDMAWNSDENTYRTITENDSLMGFLIRRGQNFDEHKNLNSFHSGVPVERVDYSKVTKTKDSKSDKNYEMEELRVNNEDLRRHIQQLLKEVEDLKKDNSDLRERLENSHTLFSDVGGSDIETLPDLPPLEMPQFDFDLLEKQDKKIEEEMDAFGSPPLDSCL